MLLCKAKQKQKTKASSIVVRPWKKESNTRRKRAYLDPYLAFMTAGCYFREL